MLSGSTCVFLWAVFAMNVSPNATCACITREQHRLWSLHQSTFKQYFTASSITYTRSNNTRPVKQYKQLHLSRKGLSHKRTITSLKELTRTIILRRKQIRQAKTMADLELFKQDGGEAELHEQVDRESVHTPVQEEEEQSVASVHSSSAEESDNEIQYLKEELLKKQQQIDSLKKKANPTPYVPQAKRRKVTHKNVKMPPPPPTGHQEAQNQRRTILALLIHLSRMITLRIDDYGAAYQKFQDLLGGKTSQAAMNIISEVLTVWNRGLLTEVGTSSCLEYLLQRPKDTWSTKSLGSATWATLIRFFSDCGSPGGTAHENTEGSSLFPTTRQQTFHTSTSSTTAHGSIPHADAGAWQDFQSFERVEEPDRSRRFESRTLQELQSTCLRKDATLYTSRSTGPIGQAIVQLSLFRTDDVKDLPRKDWWRTALFRGTVATTKKEVWEMALQLASDMEGELLERRDTHCNKTYTGSYTQSRLQ